jgi:hypothetical protein
VKYLPAGAMLSKRYLCRAPMAASLHPKNATGKLVPMLCSLQHMLAGGVHIESAYKKAAGRQSPPLTALALESRRLSSQQFCEAWPSRTRHHHE